MLKNIIDVLYKDPDKHDTLILKKAEDISKNEKMIFNADGICGWKTLFEVSNGRKSCCWLDKMH